MVDYHHVSLLNVFQRCYVDKANNLKPDNLETEFRKNSLRIIPYIVWIETPS